MTLQHSEKSTHSLQKHSKISPKYSKDVLEFLEDAEDRLEELTDRINLAQASRVTNGNYKGTQFNQHLDESHQWLRALEQRVETLIDTGELKIHLAELDARDRFSNLVQTIDNARTGIDRMVTAVEIRVADRLKSLSETCLALRQRIVGT